ncbi:MAG: dihydroorotate dehydrogenase electron transfer subunit [Lachnospiraceae bacterium]
MADKFQETCKILSHEEIGTDIYSMWLETENITGPALPGQFIAMYSNDNSRLLPRPISICEIDKTKKALHIVYRVAGTGTQEFSEMHAGQTLKVLGPLGNGFPKVEGKVLIVGGGIGIPPMLELAKQITGEKEICLGYKDECFLLEEFEKLGTVFIATEDGSVGTSGNVIDAIMKHKIEGDVIFACGPSKMLQALKTYAIEHHMECYVSMEEKMACGIGACLSCVCQSTEKDAHSKVHNKRICKEGPVFNCKEVEIR